MIHLKISTKGRYALRLMLDLAEHGNGGFISLRDVSERQDISVKYLEQIIGTLCKSGLLRSSRGAQGGYKLARRPSEYSIGDILRITEGALVPVACLESSPNECPRCSDCATIALWEGLRDVINEYLDGYTLETLLENKKSRQADDFSI